MSRIEDLEKRLSADPNSKIFVQLAEEYRKAGQPEDAVATCRDGLEKHPNYFSARVALGRALLETDGLEEARAEFETVLQQVPDNLLALKFLGEAFHKLGQLDEALSKYQLASTLSPEDRDLAERMQQVQAAAAAVHAGPSPAADPSIPPGEQSTPPTIPPAANAASQFIARQAREMGSEQVSDDVLSMQEEFEDRPVTSIFKRTAREIQDLASIPSPAPRRASPPVEPARPTTPDQPTPPLAPPPEAPAAEDAAAAPRETAMIDLGGAQLGQLSQISKRKKALGGPDTPAEPVLPEVSTEVPAEVAADVAASEPPVITPSAEETPLGSDALGDANEEDNSEISGTPGLATTTLAELYVSQGHLDRAVNVYRELVASNSDNLEFQSRLEELELLVAASKEPERWSARSSGSSSGSGGATATAPSTDPNVRFLEDAVRELEGWLAAMGRS